jgi:CheY-like chemotaxis protein
MHPNRLLVIDDEPDIRDFIKEVAEEIELKGVTWEI